MCFKAFSAIKYRAHICNLFVQYSKLTVKSGRKSEPDLALVLIEVNRQTCATSLKEQDLIILKSSSSVSELTTVASGLGLLEPVWYDNIWFQNEKAQIFQLIKIYISSKDHLILKLAFVPQMSGKVKCCNIKLNLIPYCLKYS